MEIQRLLQIFDRFWWLIAVTAVLIASAVVVYSLWQPPVYAAEMSVVIVPREGITDPGELGSIVGTLDRRTVAETFGEVVRSRTTMERASTTLQMDLIAMQQSGAITTDVIVLPATNVIRIRVESSNPEQAALIADTVGRESIVVSDAVPYPYTLQVLDTVSVPNQPVGTNLTTNAILGTVVGVLTGLGLAFAADYINQSRVRGRYGRVPS